MEFTSTGLGPFVDHAEPTVPDPDPFPAGTGSRTLDALAEMAAGRRQDEETTELRFDLGRALAELRAQISRAESLASAAQHQLSLLGYGPPAEQERRTQRVADLLAATREAATRALEVGDRIAAEAEARLD